MKILLAGVSLAVLSVMVCAQSTPPPAFEVASVKELGGGFPEGYSRAPRRSGTIVSWTTNRTNLIRYAYNLQDWQISGLGSSDSFYAINARITESASDDDLRAMWRTLLGERFGLKVHREAVERNGYWLTVNRNGSKLKPFLAGDAPAPMPAWFAGKGPEMAATLEGRIIQSAEGRGISALTGRRVTTLQVAEALQPVVGAFVLDKTGLAGNFYFGVLFASDDTREASDAPSVFAAVQEQLGLRLERQKGTVEVLIIDHAEKTPAGN